MALRLVRMSTTRPPTYATVLPASQTDTVRPVFLEFDNRAIHFYRLPFLSLDIRFLLFGFKFSHVAVAAQK
jgi:hypothetical protein